MLIAVSLTCGGSSAFVDRMIGNELMILLFERFCWMDEGLQRHFREQGWPQVSRAQSMIMISIISGTRRPSDIARRLGISRQAIHKAIGQMVDKGVVRLDEDPDDRRHKLVSLTTFGTRMRAEAQQATRNMASAIAARIGPERLQTLYEGLAADWNDGK